MTWTRFGRVAHLRVVSVGPLAALIVLCALGTVTRSASAQTPPAAPAPAPVTGGWQDGFVVQSANGDYRLTLGLTLQADGRFSLDTPAPFADTFTLRKIRPTFTGRIAKYFDYKMMPDLGGGQVVMQDAYVDLRLSPKFRFRMGKDKTPVGYELLVGDAYVLFPERSLATGLIPNRDNGVQVQGDVLANKLSYSAGVFNGIPDGTSSSTEVDTNNGKDLAARIVLQPFRSAATPARPLSGLGFHLGASSGTQTGALPSFKTSATQTYFSYVTGATADGRRTRVTPAVFYYFKSFGGFAEYVMSKQDVSRASTVTNVSNHAWDVTTSYVVTGDTTTDRGVRPKNNFDPAAGHWGALQLLARVGRLTTDAGAFTAGLAAASASREATQYSVEANWYPNYWIKYYVSYERTNFAGGNASRPAENAVILRTQVAF
jgi:phosphate-selective porin OprO/OprP